MARPVLQTTGSLGVSYIVFRGMKQLLSNHVPERWLQVEEAHMSKVNELANKMTERLHDSLPNIPEKTRNDNIILRTIYESFQKVKVYEIAIYLLTILVVIILPPLLSLHMDKKKKAAIEAFEKKQKKEKDEDEERQKKQEEIEDLGHRLEEMRQNEKVEEEETRKDLNQTAESTHVEETEEGNLSNRSINKNTEEIRLSLTKEERQKLKEEKEKEQNLIVPDVTEIDEITETGPKNESLVSPALHHSGQEGTEEIDSAIEDKVAYEQHNFIDKIDPLRENDGIDLEDGFKEVDHLVSPLEPEIIVESVQDISQDNIDTVQEVHEETVKDQEEDDDDQEEQEPDEEKETLGPEQIIVLEKTTEQPRIPSLTNPTGSSFDSQSSLHTQVLLPPATSSSYIQFSPTKTSDLKVEINKKNAYSQPFEY
ncbi:hypothetical protein C6P45_004540 [Maudiozyma exigua]|uniref:Uncharacterized protein n=1 Tax=Maudiozyma exigua TaxID=34358 RepID=A0A9P6WAQ1_MAUEX|nr:hypothetical protein C6P45_004540 [Kazachstania exigua]